MNEWRGRERGREMDGSRVRDACMHGWMDVHQLPVVYLPIHSASTLQHIASILGLGEACRLPEKLVALDAVMMTNGSA